jgi:hypothetical protein
MRPVVIFYRPFIAPATFFSLFTCYLLLAWGSSYYVLTLFWIKAFSTALLGAIFHFTRDGQLSFYHNLGYSTRRLYLLTAGLDFMLWLLFIIICIQFV